MNGDAERKMPWFTAGILLGLLITTPAIAGPQVTIYAHGLEIPWAMAFAPDGRAFVTERPGRVRVIRNGRLDPKPVAVLPVAHVGEGGLLGLALDPEFPRRPFVYVYYTYQEMGLRNRVERLREEDGRLIRDRVMLDGIPGAFVHDGGRIAFGPDGMLYIGTGDARNMDLAQNRQSLAGKILRITPDGQIPGDNPIASSPVYSLGHRNVQGLAWHPETKRLYATEHGPSGERGCCQDEVNVIRPGSNYGWPEVTGDEHSRDAPYITPLAHSGRETWAPSGAAFISSGPWRGRFLFATLRDRHLRMLVLSQDGVGVVRQERLVEGFGLLRDVVEGPDGTLYVLTNNQDGRGSPAPDDDRILRIQIAR
jgi:glucose/arabinose dehydrogenase